MQVASQESYLFSGPCLHIRHIIELYYLLCTIENKLSFLHILEVKRTRNLNPKGKQVRYKEDICIGRLKPEFLFSRLHKKQLYTIPVTISDKDQYLSTA